MLTAIRSYRVRGIKANLSHFYKHQLECPLQCNSEKPFIDTYEHSLTCTIIQNSPNIEKQTPISCMELSLKSIK